MPQVFPSLLSKNPTILISLQRGSLPALPRFPQCREPGPGGPFQTAVLASEKHLLQSLLEIGTQPEAAGWPPKGASAVPAAGPPLSMSGAQIPSGGNGSLQTSLMTWGRGQLPGGLIPMRRRADDPQSQWSQHQPKQDEPLLRSCVSTGQAPRRSQFAGRSSSPSSH